MIMITQQLLDYIKEQLKLGIEREKITTDLLANGWARGDIVEGFENVEKLGAVILDPRISIPVGKTKKHGVRTFFLVLLLFLLAIGVGAYYFKDNLINYPIVKQAIDFKNKILGQEEISIQIEETAMPQKEVRIQDQEINANSIITQKEAEALVFEKWDSRSPGECGGKVTITVNENNMISAIFPNCDDSVAFTKKEATATYRNGTWILETPVSTWACHLNRGHQDFNTTPCI
jgi:hypothetical protein